MAAGRVLLGWPVGRYSGGRVNVVIGGILGTILPKVQNEAMTVTFQFTVGTVSASGVSNGAN